MQGTQKQIGKYIVLAFTALVLGINMLLTFMFGGTYGAQTFPTSIPAVSFALGGLMLTVFYDWASFAWFIARSREDQSIAQRAIATILAAASMLASVMVSAIQLAMTTTLVDLSAAHGSIGVFGLIMAITMASAHFIGLFAYKFTDPEYAEADADASLAAEVNSFRIKQKSRVALKMMAKTQSLMDQQVDEIALIEAENLWANLRTQLYTSPQLTNGQQQPIIIDHEPTPTESKPSKRDDIATEKRGNYTITIDGKPFTNTDDYIAAKILVEQLAEENPGQTIRLMEGNKLVTSLSVAPDNQPVKVSVNGASKDTPFHSPNGAAD